MTHVALVTEASNVPDERFLISRAQQGDREAARSLYDAHARRVHRLVFRLCGDEELARDFTQDTFIRVFDKLSTFRGESAFATWVHRIAVTVTLNGLRKERRLRRGSDDLDVATDLPAPSDNVDPDLRARLRSAIEGLPPGAPGLGDPARHRGLHARGNRHDAWHRRRHQQGTAVRRPQPVAESAVSLRQGAGQ